ncbi:hypothetical protein JIG36_48700 [Actinoplanes sp. LDG1-06]|uniref:Lipoprotein n=1 Tax=Paractinoplanes ovalisporus TaxID=2810368 RepID=A0ABS2AU59_9ACTN|nr:hypothetical protein [Actinoplanes ovalisporus]MBM2623402.1 hypothetical protein [Actinoplanes ovalisporus]
MAHPARMCAAVAVAATLLVLVGCSSGDKEKAQPDPPAPAPTGTAIEADDPLVAPTANCPRPPQEPTTATEPESGGLTARTTYMLGGGEADFAYDVAAFDRQRTAFEVADMRSLSIDDTFAQGAYAVGGGHAIVVVANASDQPIDIAGIHPVNLVRECMPLAAAFLGGGEAGDEPKMYFDLDLAAPEARAFNNEGEDPTLFFQEKSWQIPARGEDEGQIDFDTQLGAYSFDLAIEYQIDGEQYLALLDNKGQPFRITSSLCASSDDLVGLPDAAVQRLKSLRYQRVRQRGLEFVMADVDPEQVAADCPW